MKLYAYFSRNTGDVSVLSVYVVVGSRDAVTRSAKETTRLIIGLKRKIAKRLRL